MLVARSYAYDSSKRAHSSSPTNTSPHDNATTSGLRKSAPASAHHITKKSSRVTSESSMNLSSPVAVPVRDPRTPERYAHKSKLHNRHDPSSMPASVSALLAMTQIPARKPIKQRPVKSLTRRMSPESLRKEWDAMDRMTQSLSSSPQMDILLSPPDEIDEEMAMQSVDDDDDCDQDDDI